MKTKKVLHPTPSEVPTVVTKYASDPKFFNRLWDESWTYIKTVVDVLREPVLILNKDLCILAANDPFLETFQVRKVDTIGEQVYQLGNGQWDIPELRKLLSEILPKHTFFKGFQVAHDFPGIGRKVMFLNARQIFFKDESTNELVSPIILLAIEDVTQIINITQKLEGQASLLEAMHMERTRKLESYIALLELKVNEIITNQKKMLKE